MGKIKRLTWETDHRYEAWSGNFHAIVYQVRSFNAGKNVWMWCIYREQNGVVPVKSGECPSEGEARTAAEELVQELEEKQVR